MNKLFNYWGGTLAAWICLEDDNSHSLMGMRLLAQEGLIHHEGYPYKNICCLILLELHKVPDTKTRSCEPKSYKQSELRKKNKDRTVRAKGAFLAQYKWLFLRNMVFELHEQNRRTQRWYVHSPPLNLIPKKKNTAQLISKKEENISRLSGIHYNIVQRFLSLKGLSEAGMPQRRGSFRACSWQ